MSENLCSLKKKGGGGSSSETTLWTNNAPASSFVSQTVNLSDNISHYDYIAIELRVGTADEHFTYYFKASDMPDFVTNRRVVLGIRHSNNYYYYRMLTYSSDTALLIGDCIRNMANGSASVNNGGVIPQTIKGLK